MHVQVGHSWLRNGMHAQSLRFLPEKSRNQSFDNISLDLFGKTLLDN